MHNNTMNREQVLKLIRKRRRDMTLKQSAEDLGVSLSYLSEIYRGTRAPGPKVLRALGIKSKVEYTVED